MTGLTRLQRDRLDYVARYYAAHGYGPSFAELMGVMGVRSKFAVFCTIEPLIRRGLLARDGACSGRMRLRTLRPTTLGWSVLGRPPMAPVAYTLEEPTRCRLCGLERYGKHSPDLCRFFQRRAEELTTPESNPSKISNGSVTEVA